MHNYQQQRHTEAQQDERLTVDDITPKMMRIPLDEISFSTSSRAENDDDSIVSTISNDDLEDDHTLQVVNEVPRSIFSNYWKEGTGDEIRGRPSSPQQQQQKKLLPSCDNNIMDGYKYFGIDRSEVERANSNKECDDHDSINTYERMLQRYEKPSPRSNRQTSSSSSRPSWMAFFGGSGYHFSSEPQFQNLGTKPTRFAQSDTALLKKPKRSCLRSGRFASSGDTMETTANNNNNNSQQQQQHVTFQPKIEIQVFQPPVEKWAPSGWSDWFG
jgi:hypothetical protein